MTSEKARSSTFLMHQAFGLFVQVYISVQLKSVVSSPWYEMTGVSGAARLGCARTETTRAPTKASREAERDVICQVGHNRFLRSKHLLLYH